MTTDEYFQLLNDTEIDCLDDDLKTLCSGREWQKNFIEGSVNVQIILYLGALLRNCNNATVVEATADSAAKPAAGALSRPPELTG